MRISAMNDGWRVQIVKSGRPQATSGGEWDRCTVSAQGRHAFGEIIESKAIGALAVADASIDFVTKERLKDAWHGLIVYCGCRRWRSPAFSCTFPEIDRLHVIVTPIIRARPVISALTTIRSSLITHKRLEFS